MFAVGLYLVSLLIAPQLWIPPFIGWPADYIIFPLLMFAAYLRPRETKSLGLYSADWFLLGLTFWIAIGAVVNGLTDGSKSQIFFYCKFLLLYKLVAFIIGDVERVRKFVGIFIFLVVVLAIGAIAQNLSADGSGWASQGRSWIDPSVIAAGGVGRSRWIGIFDGPGVFCVLFTMCLPFLLQRLGREVPTPTRFFNLLLIVTVLWATYCTGARGGFLASLAVIGLYILIRAKVSFRTIVLISALVFLVYTFAPEHLTTINDSSRSTQHRVEMWAEGLDMIKESPVFGIGRGNFSAYTGSLIAHNSAVQIMGETGLVGFYFWIGLIYVSVRGCVAYYQGAERPEDRNFALGLILSLFGYLVSAFFVTLEYETFYLLLAACNAISRSAPVPFRLGLRDFGTIGGILVAAVIGIQIFCIVYLG